MSDQLARLTHAAHELERWARMRLYEQSDQDMIKHARQLMRLCIGVRRNLEHWPTVSAHSHTRPRSSARPRVDHAIDASAASLAVSKR